MQRKIQIGGEESIENTIERTEQQEDEKEKEYLKRKTEIWE